MGKSKVLIQVDPGDQPSTFDSLVAIDADADHLLRHSAVTPDQVQELVHGAIFTRGIDDLKSTALFFGGNDVAATEALVAQAKSSFFGKLRVSLMSDPNGCNTTAAASVISAAQHIDLAGKTVTILGGTGPVGTRIAHLLAGPATGDDSVMIRITSRKRSKAAATCKQLLKRFPGANIIPCEAASSEQIESAVCDAHVVFAAGAVSVELLDERWKTLPKLEVAIDLNAVPPSGIMGIEATDFAKISNGTTCYGAIGVGNLKMKIHKQALRMLFETNDLILEVEEIFAIGQEI